MVRRVVSFLICITMLVSAPLALAGGAVAPAYPPAACGPRGYAPAGNPCAFWGDAPFPGMCGGVVALPFLVVGSLLGGNTVGPYPPVPAPGYAPRAAIRPAVPGPVAAPAYGAPYGVFGGSILTGLPCADLCANIFGGLTGNFGLGL